MLSTHQQQDDEKDVILFSPQEEERQFPLSADDMMHIMDEAMDSTFTAFHEDQTMELDMNEAYAYNRFTPVQLHVPLMEDDVLSWLALIEEGTRRLFNAYFRCRDRVRECDICHRALNEWEQRAGHHQFELINIANICYDCEEVRAIVSRNEGFISAIYNDPVFRFRLYVTLHELYFLPVPCHLCNNDVNKLRAKINHFERLRSECECLIHDFRFTL